MIVPDVPAALAELGLPADIHDTEAYCLCPFHDDRRAGSFSVSTRTGLYNCFSCGARGAFWQLVATVLEVSGHEARRWCATRGVIRTDTELPEETPAPPRVTEASLALFTAPPDRQLSRRGLTASACADLGILWDPGDRAWIIPIRDPTSGALLGWQSKSRDRVRNHPRGVRKSLALFGLELARAENQERLILVESPLDVARLRATGIRGGVASYGARVSRDQLRMIARYGDSLVLALDNDPPGLQAARELSVFRKLPVWLWNYGTSPVKDPGEQTDSDLRWSLDHLLPACAYVHS
jgi:hypothetical protein